MNFTLLLTHTVHNKWWPTENRNLLDCNLHSFHILVPCKIRKCSKNIIVIMKHFSSTVKAQCSYQSADLFWRLAAPRRLCCACNPCCCWSNSMQALRRSRTSSTLARITSAPNCRSGRTRTSIRRFEYSSVFSLSHFFHNHSTVQAVEALILGCLFNKLFYT